MIIFCTDLIPNSTKTLFNAQWVFTHEDYSAYANIQIKAAQINNDLFIKKQILAAFAELKELVHKATGIDIDSYFQPKKVRIGV